MATRPGAPRARGRTSWPATAAAAACLVLGFADLLRGGTTASAVLLVVGYCVGVPVALLTERRGRGD